MTVDILYCTVHSCGPIILLLKHKLSLKSKELHRGQDAEYDLTPTTTCFPALYDYSITRTMQIIKSLSELDKTHPH